MRKKKRRKQKNQELNHLKCCEEIYRRAVEQAGSGVVKDLKAQLGEI